MSGRLDHTRWLIGHTRQLLAPLGIAVAASVVGKALGVALLVVSVWALTRMAAGADLSVAGTIGLLVGIALAKALLRYLEHFAGHYVAFTALQRLRELFFESLVPQAPAATQGEAGADLTERATRDIDRIEVFFAHTLPPMVAAVVVPAGYVAWLALAVDGASAVVVGLFAAAALLLPALAARGSWSNARRVARRRGAIAAHVADDVQGLPEVLSMGAGQRRLKTLADHDDDLIAARTRAGLGTGLRSAGATALRAAGLIAVLLVAQPSIDAMALGLAVSIALWGPTRGVDDFVTGLDSAFAATARVREIVDRPALITQADEPQGLPQRSDVVLDRVSFAYPGATRSVLDDVSLRFDQASWSYLVGVSGSGKSSVAGLVMRGWDPQGGAVTLGGVSVDRLPLDALRERVGFVAQRPTLLRGTIAENLRLARPDASDETLWEALRAVALEEWVDSLPGGLEHRVSARGVNVSGGQLQRLALARALVAEPQVLILDEALSQLDGPTLVLVRERLAASLRGLTVIEISHRADLIPDDAQVWVVDAGRVVAQGRVGMLRATDGPFARLEARG